MAFDFDGANSKVEATSQPGLTTGPSTFVACVLPRSAGEGSAGMIFSTSSSSDGLRRQFRINTNNRLRLVVVRATTNTDYQASNRALVNSTAAARRPAIVAATFDEAATPEVHLYATSNGTDNDNELVECTYSTNTDGAGAVTSDGAGTAKYTIGNRSTQANTWDGQILWVAIVPAVLSLEELAPLAGGVNPVAVVGHIAGAKIIHLGADDGNAIDLLDPAGSTWTATSVTTSDELAPFGGDYFAPAAFLNTTDLVENKSGSGSITETATVTGSGTTARSGTASISATPAVTGTQQANRQGSSSISATPTVTGNGAAARTGAVTISATPTVSSSAEQARAGSGTISATPTVTGAGTATKSSTAAITATPTVTGSGTAARGGTTSINATVTATGSGTAARSGTGVIGGTPTVTGEGGTGRFDDAAITATAVVAGAGRADRAGAALVPASVGVASTGSSARSGVGTITAAPAVTGSGTALVTGHRLDIRGPTRVTGRPVTRQTALLVRSGNRVVLGGSAQHADPQP